MLDLFSTPQPKTPRPHQVRTLDLLRNSIHGRKTRPCIQLPTGAGKTYLAAMIVQGALAKGNRVVFTVPALSLIDQTVEMFEAEGIGDIGVIQADHPRTNPLARIQVASVQTLGRREKPIASIVIVDEAHIGSKVIRDWMAECPKTIFIGLSATPWRKGMAEEYDDLIIGSTMSELIEAGYLSPYRGFAPSSPDLTGVKTLAGDYKQDQLSDVMSENVMVADVVTTWLERAENRPTLCFAVDCAHARKLQVDFESAGVNCGYVDAYTDKIERKLVEQKLAQGKYSVVCNVGCCTTGIDWDVRCIILARPTKSEMLYTQMIGRGLRTADGKQDCLILDHSDNTLRLGFVTDIQHEELKSGSVASAEKSERMEPLPKKCSSCDFLKPPKIRQCPNCGFKPEIPKSDIEFEDGELVEMNGRGASTQTQKNMYDKQNWYSQLQYIQQDRQRAKGWLAHAYKDKFGVWPKGLDAMPQRPSQEVLNFVKAKDIRYAKARNRAHAV